MLDGRHSHRANKTDVQKKLGHMSNTHGFKDNIAKAHANSNSTNPTKCNTDTNIHNNMNIYCDC